MFCSELLLIRFKIDRNENIKFHKQFLFKVVNNNTNRCIENVFLIRYQIGFYLETKEW